ncbi:MAG: hypothetical protein OXJ52_01430 [Oligoflexia bacterium]|nr:hypothetical protein [Oligoflexia bacterium]
MILFEISVLRVLQRLIKERLDYKVVQYFLENKISANELVDKWLNKEVKLEPLEEDILHELDLYISDTDIHEKDPEYKKCNSKKFKKLIIISLRV